MSDSDDDEDLDLFGEMTPEEKEAKAKKDAVSSLNIHAAGYLSLLDADDAAQWLHIHAVFIADVMLQPCFASELILLYNDTHLFQSRALLSVMK